MPFEERTIQEYGVVIDHIFFWDDALRPWIHARDPEDSKRPRKFTFRIIPRYAGNLFPGTRQQQLHRHPLP
jgi:putative transposase